MTAVPSGTFALAFAVGLVGIFALSGSALAAEPAALDTPTIIKNVNTRPQGDHVVRDIKMVLTDRNGRERVRDAKGFRLDTPEERRALIVFNDPSNIKDTAFLTYDYHVEGTDDQQWLYLPAQRKSRRVSGAERGEYFLGTGFTFEDLKQEGSVGEHDYDYTIVEVEGKADHVVTIRGIPKSVHIARELGYGEIETDIDTNTWMIMAHRIKDVSGRPLKTFEFGDHQKVDGIWTAASIFVDNLKTGHKTLFEFSNIDFATEVRASQLDQRNLKRAGK